LFYGKENASMKVEYKLRARMEEFGKYEKKNTDKLMSCRRLIVR
jgi:hypothetical protein